MGNCCKKTSDIFGEYNLLEPLVTSEDHTNASHTSPCQCDTKINKLTAQITTLQSNLDLLEKNTQDNLRLLSEDIHYINSKQSCEDTSNYNLEYEEEQEATYEEPAAPPPAPEENYEEDYEEEGNTQESKEFYKYHLEEDYSAT
jgi:hypothetical protein